MHGGDQDSERLYRWHIEARTGGVEGKKASVDDYVEACVALLKSVETRGFMQERPVLLDPDGRLFNGAHRVSLGLAINKPLYVRQVNAPAKRTWGFDWFADHGMSRADLLRLVEDWCLLRGVE